MPVLLIAVGLIMCGFGAVGWGLAAVVLGCFIGAHD